MSSTTKAAHEPSDEVLNGAPSKEPVSGNHVVEGEEEEEESDDYDEEAEVDYEVRCWKLVGTAIHPFARRREDSL